MPTHEIMMATHTTQQGYYYLGAPTRQHNNLQRHNLAGSGSPYFLDLSPLLSQKMPLMSNKVRLYSLSRQNSILMGIAVLAKSITFSQDGPIFLHQ